jgi:Protein of unknown function (DUF3263)
MVRANSEQVSALSERDVAMLEFESRWSRHTGAKEEAIKRLFGLSAARYYQVLNVVIDSPAAVRHDPMLVRRLQRARETRLAARSSRAFSSTTGDTIESPQIQ